MDETIKKSIRNGIYGFIPTILITFIYGGLYNEMIIENIGITLKNIILALIGSIIAGTYIFILIFIISLIIYYYKN